MNTIRFKDITLPSVDKIPEKGRYVYRNCTEDSAHILRIRTEDTPNAAMYVLLGPEIHMQTERRKELIRAVNELTGDDSRDFGPCISEYHEGCLIKFALVYHRSLDFNVIYHMFKTVYGEES